jgi:microcystin-dependent protein
MQSFARKNNYSSFQIPQDSAPIGSITPYGSNTLPSGWLLCDGSAVSRTTYAELFALLGTTWGIGDNSTTFNVPDLRGASPAGVGTSSGYTTNESISLGEKSNDTFQNHRHQTYPYATGSGTAGTVGLDNADHTNQSSVYLVGDPASDLVYGINPRTNNVTKGKTVGVNFIIKALMITTTQLLISDGTLSTKATGSEVDAGTNDAKFITPKALLDSTYANEAYADAKVADAINDGTTTIAPSQNAVYDALVLNNSAYKLLYYGAGSHIAGRTANTYIFPPAGGVMVVSGVGTLYPQQVFRIRNADFPTINGKATKLRISGSVHCNDVAPTGNFTFGLHPITRPATSGGAGLVIYTAGTVVSGSNGAVVTTPAADSSTNAVGSDFAIPADGWYALCCVTTATVAVSAHTHLTCELQMRNP